MKIVIARDYEEMSERAAKIIIDLIRRKPNAVLGLATGATPIRLYQLLVQAYQRRELSFEKVTTFNLDDYVGLNKESRDSFYSYMHEKLFSQIDIRPENINLLDGAASNLTDECLNYERLIKAVGGIDLQLLGIGLDGHIGFAEPGSSFDGRTFVVNLTKSTIETNVKGFVELKQSPTQGITMGIGTIMEARQILMLANGLHKAPIIHKAFYGPVTEDVPASVLQRHPDCLIVLDAAAAGE